ncbi:MAG: DEAD/DEAH box helicase [Erysipelotrichaceae bacterium]|nr:DEAD/DEAH box helicase [Erysipelotrichaceae bacterium]
MNQQLKKETQRFIELNGFRELTKIQEACIEMAAKDKDIIAVSATGTGKTHAFLIPIMERIDPEKEETQAVISAPTRELAFQIHRAAKLMKEVYPSLRIKLLSGGTDSVRSREELKNVPQIIIGTPGRIKDLFLNNVIRVDKVKVFVVDEADMTLEYGFLEDIDAVFSHMVKEPEIMCFSATFPEALRPFVRKYLNNPQIIRIEEAEKLSPRIRHVAIACKHRSYGETLLQILPGFDPYVCLIFGNTREECNEVYDQLRAAGYRAVLLHGGLESRERQKAMRALASQEYRYVVASDVAARGIDIEGITHVVSLGFPSDLSFYTHRAGRTGRSGKEGTCFALYQEKDTASLKTLRKQGISFRFRSFRGNEWRDLQDPFAPRKKRNDEREKELAKILTKKKEKVKPNYRKKKKEAIERIRRKERQEFIRSKIREEKKARYRAAARKKVEE